jgi:hypothetical protein
VKKLLLLVVALVMALGFAANAAEKGKLELKVGDEVYVCNCGEMCTCDTMAKKPGNCTCGKEMVKGKVTKVEAGKATVLVGGKERILKTVGKYACACGAACDCGTISQNPGKCVCGKEMEPVK